MKNFLKHSRKWSALLIGLIITVFLSVLVLGFLDKVLGVGKNAKSIEHSTQAYYLATGIIEKKLCSHADLKKSPWTLWVWDINNNTNLMTAFSGANLLVHATSRTIPAPWKWNSPLDRNYNIISLDRPVQLVIPEGVSWGDVNFEFKTPTGELYSTENNTGAIMWTIGNSSKILYANSEDNNGLFWWIQINSSNNVNINKKNGITFDANWVRQTKDFNGFYTQNLWTHWQNCQEYKCTLRLSLLRNLKNNNGSMNNFLHYKITGLNKDIPEQYMTLTAKWKVGYYYRERIVQIPQITANTALDFAVLQ